MRVIQRYLLYETIMSSLLVGLAAKAKMSHLVVTNIIFLLIDIYKQDEHFLDFNKIVGTVSIDKILNLGQQNNLGGV